MPPPVLSHDSTPHAVVRLAADEREGPTLADLKALALGHLEGGTAALVLDLRAAGHLHRRALGTLVYVLALYREAGGQLCLCATPEQRGSLTPYAPLFLLSEDGDVTSSEDGDVTSNPPSADGFSSPPPR